MPKIQQMLLITVRSAQLTVDLELPGDEPIQNLLPLLIDICGIYSGRTPAKQVTTLWSSRPESNGRPLQAASTLCDNGILDGDIIFLQAGAQLPAHLMTSATPASPQETGTLRPS
ncbi:MAG TPA: EsaB/YukD family protein, partial [Ktedonobacteraceae bacterium]